MKTFRLFVFTCIAVLYAIQGINAKTIHFANSNETQDSNVNQLLTKSTELLHSNFDNLLRAHVSKEGNVNYEGFRTDHDKLLEYIEDLKSAYSDLSTFSKNDQLAYWINAYNALTIDLILQNYPVKSIKDIKKPWDQKLWQFGVKSLNLNEIEHKILRKMDEPRIHFAIVCASISCPKLQNRAYTGDDIEDQLTQATKDFLNDPTKNKISENQIELSKIFKWFSKDFKTYGSIVDFINLYSTTEIAENAKLSFLDYNWGLND